jgi:hypothetical protein
VSTSSSSSSSTPPTQPKLPSLFHIDENVVTLPPAYVSPPRVTLPALPSPTASLTVQIGPHPVYLVCTYCWNNRVFGYMDQNKDGLCCHSFRHDGPTSCTPSLVTCRPLSSSDFSLYGLKPPTRSIDLCAGCCMEDVCCSPASLATCTLGPPTPIWDDLLILVRFRSRSIFFSTQFWPLRFCSELKQ